MFERATTLRRLPLMARAGVAFLRGTEEVKQPPLNFWLEPTNACNLKCVMCPTGLGLKRKSGLMKWELFERIIEQIDHIPAVINLHHSGESLLHPRIFDMTRYIRERGGFVGYFTNATFLDEKRRQKIRDHPPNWLGFSFDGYDRESYEAVRVGSNWDLALGNIERFLIEKRQLGVKEPYTYMSIVELDSVSKNLPEETKKNFRAHLLSLGLDQMAVATTHNWAGLVQLTGLVKDSGRKWKQAPYTNCPFPWSGISILYDGRVVPCCMDMEAEYVLGDLNEESLLDIWNNDRMRELRGALKSGRAAEIALCKDCHVLQDKSFLGVPKRVWTEAADIVRTEATSVLPRKRG